MSCLAIAPSNELLSHSHAPSNELLSHSHMSEDHQMQIFRAGIVFAQHVQVNTNRLSALAFRMQEQLTELSCSMAAGSAEVQQKVHATAPQGPRMLLPPGLSESCTSSVADGQVSVADELEFAEKYWSLQFLSD